MSYETNNQLRRRLFLSLVWEGNVFEGFDRTSGDRVSLSITFETGQVEVRLSSDREGAPRSKTFRFDGQGKLTTVFASMEILSGLSLHETDRCFQRHQEEREAADLMGRLERMRQNGELRHLER